MSWCNKVTDVGACAVAAACPLLELLSVHGNRNVTSRLISTLVEHNRGGLKTLDLNGCVGVLENKERLRELMPSLTTFIHHT
mmetsp:Transcript_3791/g.9074  ORF Transcript_3791/g.9074 Transcript_3791/m.9074 type:complete len:82 (-) Transcript_3791:130-375(-)